MMLKKTMLQMSLLGALCLSGCYATQSGQSNYTMNVVSGDKLVRRYDRPVDVVLPAVRKALTEAGVVTAEDATINVISARVNTRYVWVKIEADEESDNISRVTYQVRTKSSWLVAGRNPDVQLAAELAEDTFRNLVAQENPQP